MKGDHQTAIAVERPRRSYALPTTAIAVLTLVVSLCLAVPLIQGKLYINNDLAQYHLPLRAFYAQCLKTRCEFAWMPSILCGYYAHGEGQVGMYHPFHLALYRFLPLTWAFNLELVSSYPFMFAGMLLFFRRWKLPWFAALFGAFAFTFSGFNLLHYMHVNLIAVVAHIPWLLYALDIGLLSSCPRMRRRAYLATALLTASQLLCGFPQAVYFSLVAEAIFTTVLIAHRQSPDHVVTLAASWRYAAVRGAWLAASKILALALAAVQLLPSLDALSTTTRPAAGAEFRYFFSLHPANLLQLIGPYFFQGYVGMNEDGPKQSHEAGLYIGTLGALFVLWTLAGRGRAARSRSEPESETETRSPRVLLRAAAILGFAGLILALGKHTLVYPLLSHLPIVGALRAPCRHIVLFHFAVSCLLALAAADLAREPAATAPRPYRVFMIIALPVTAGWLAAVVLLAARLDGLRPLLSPIVTRTMWYFLTSPKEILVGPALMTVAAAVFALTILVRSRALVAILLLAAGADQAWYASRLIRLEQPVDLASLTASVPVPPSAENYRVYALMNNSITLHGASNASGYSGLELRNEVAPDFFKPNTLRIAGVRWANNDWPSLGKPMTWTEIADPLPIVRMVTKMIDSATPAQILTTTDLRTTAISSCPLDLIDGEQGSASLAASRPGFLQIHALNVTRQLLVIAESYHPGWRATVDGAPREILRVNGNFMGCVLEPGSHNITLQFDPQSLRNGKRITICALSVLALTLCLAIPMRVL